MLALHQQQLWHGIDLVVGEVEMTKPMDNNNKIKYNFKVPKEENQQWMTDMPFHPKGAL